MKKFSLPDDLYDYQKEDSIKMMGEGNFLNFSEMGVGKTPTTLNVIESGGYNIPLIVCPNSLRLEWARQIGEWVAEDYTAVCTTDSYTKLGPIIESLRDGRKYKVLNYEVLRKEENLDILKHIPFDIIVFDEVHKLRNPKTKLVEGEKKKQPYFETVEEILAWDKKERLGGVWKFLSQHENAKVIGLSGSPIMNYPNDLYVPLSITHQEEYPRDYQNYRYFQSKYCLSSTGPHGSYIYGSMRMRELKEETERFIIRRTKKEVLPLLPDKYYNRTLLEMKPDQRKLYDNMLLELKILLDTGETLSSPNVLACLTRLRQINLDPKILGVTASSAKTDYLLDVIEGMIGERGDGEKLVIFSCFEKYIYLLHLMLSNIPHVVITGKVPSDKRQGEVNKFQNDPSIKICLGTIGALGEGMTLTASSTVLMADRWWNQPTNQQAEDRIHRIGQKNACEILLPVVSNSVDEILDEILERKRESSDAYYQEAEVREAIVGML